MKRLHIAEDLWAHAPGTSTNGRNSTSRPRTHRTTIVQTAVDPEDESQTPPRRNYFNEALRSRKYETFPSRSANRLRPFCLRLPGRRSKKSCDPFLADREREPV